MTTPHGRATPAWQNMVVRIGLALAGRAGARLAAAIGLNCGRDTLLRRVRAQPDPPRGEVTVAGVDDFALRKRLRYATVLVDMHTRRPVDVLTDRRIGTTQAWLRDHPEVQVVCRDGSAAYAEAINTGAPQASQVSDRWHLWKGLSDATLKEVATHSNYWAKTGPPIREGRRAATTRERWHHVHDLLDRGVGLLECARRLNLALNTVKRYARITEPERLVRAPVYRPTLVDPYREHLRRRRAADPAVAVTQLLKEIKALGYQGSANLLVRYINQGRAENDRSSISPRRLTSLILTHPEHLTDTQRHLRDELTSACPEMIDLGDAVRSFADLLTPNPGNATRLREWITAVRSYDLPYLHSFTRGLDKDTAAVTAGLTLPYSNGPTEGHVNRIKMIKRQMYGRAGLDLLRKRVLLTN
ncbi:Transposase [Haloechinothrix alba]|uniref:Transposase n=1 Tax=Haloechinothrix alba TaxID=664784 RepID=A0A238ZXV6_9PSEU|nr:Transposase [Haloechinothrix alba]